MVCSSGNGRMKVVTRLLSGGSFSQTVPADFARQKSAAEYINKQLREADEANLLSEEDMHIYGERPMTDPLQLVCCKNCKRPVKDSQFAAHAELCRSLQLTEQTCLKLDGNTGNRKPPRKQRKKLSNSCATTAVAEQRRSESVDNIDTAVSQSHLNRRIRVAPFSNRVKDAASMLDDTGINGGNSIVQASLTYPPPKRYKSIASTHLDVPERHGTESGVTKTVNLTNGITRKDLGEKTVSEHGDPVHKNVRQVHMRQKHVTTNGKDLVEKTVSEHGDPVHKNVRQVHMRQQHVMTNGKDLVEKTVSEHGDPVHKNVRQVHMRQQHVMTNGKDLVEKTVSEHGDPVLKNVRQVHMRQQHVMTNGKDLVEKTVSEHGDPVHKNVGQVHMQQQHVMTKDFPAPLATKIYYSQRTNRLRAAIRHMYFENLSEELFTDVAGQKTSLGENVALQDSSQGDPSFQQMDNVLNKESHSAIIYSPQNPDHVPAKSSEVCLLKAGGVPSVGLSDQFVLDNVSRSAATNVGLTRGNFLPKAYSFASNTGNPLGTMQQTKGRVPVI